MLFLDDRDDQHCKPKCHKELAWIILESVQSSGVCACAEKTGGGEGVLTNPSL